MPIANWNGITDFSWNASDGIDYAAADANLNITLTPVNDPPSFTLCADVTVLEDSGPQLLTDWMSNISAGPPDETGQALAFTLTTNHDELLSALPTITLSGTSGTSASTPAPAANGREQ